MDIFGSIKDLNNIIDKQTLSIEMQRQLEQEQLLEQQKFDILIQDELNHPSLIAANAEKHPYPIISIVHHLRCSELRPKWQNAFYRMIEKKYVQSVDGLIFNSMTTQNVVHKLIGDSKPNIIAYPPTDRFGEAISRKNHKPPKNESFANPIPRKCD